MNRTLRSWLVTLGVAGLLLGVLAAVGGFGRAHTDGEQALPVGAPIDIGRWSVTVERAQLVNTNMSGAPLEQSRVVIWLTLTNTGLTSGYGPSEDAIAFLGPTGYLDEDAPLFYVNDPAEPSLIGPGLTRERFVEFPITDADWADGDPVKVLLGREQPSDGGFSNVEGWTVSRIVGVVRVPVEDRRE